MSEVTLYLAGSVVEGGAARHIALQAHSKDVDHLI
jgi:hypothetical protein